MTQRTQISAPSLTSLRAGYRAMVFGASGGLGAAFTHHLSADPRCGQILAAARKPITDNGKIVSARFDLTDEGSIIDCITLAARDEPIDLVIVATGYLHNETTRPEKTYRALEANAMAQAFAVNAIGPALIAKHALGFMPKQGKSVFAALSARVGSISDNRAGGWHSYRASKAALNMILKTCAIELSMRRPDAVCIGLHPGTVETNLSAPFRAGVAQEKIFTPEESAHWLLSVINAATPKESGALLAWDGAPIPF